MKYNRHSAQRGPRLLCKHFNLFLSLSLSFVSTPNKSNILHIGASTVSQKVKTQPASLAAIWVSLSGLLHFQYSYLPMAWETNMHPHGRPEAPVIYWSRSKPAVGHSNWPHNPKKQHYKVLCHQSFLETSIQWSTEDSSAPYYNTGLC